MHICIFLWGLVEQQIREWAYKLDATVGEIPTSELIKALHQWTSRKMDEAQYDFQQYFFYELGQKQFDKQSARNFGFKPQSKSMLAFMRLPEVFTAQNVDEVFGYNGNRNSINSKIQRLRKDALIKKIRSGEDKGKFRKQI